MNLLKRIKIENIKGKDSFELVFADLTANQPNIIVAPNGYGKSTIAKAFKAATNGKLKLDPKDVYQQKLDNHPRLEVELCGDDAGIFISTDTDGQISKHISIYTISSPLFAKNTTKNFGKKVTATADLRIEQVIIYDKIPDECSLNYSYRALCHEFSEKKIPFLNIADMLTNSRNINALLEIEDCFKKCCIQKGNQSEFARFLTDCTGRDKGGGIKQQISQENIAILRKNENIAKLFDCIVNMKNKPVDWCDADVVFTAIQLCKIMEQYYSAGDKGILKKVNAFLEYKEIRRLIDERLELFNTTGRKVRTQVESGKLVINFDRAASMSNGEWDILSFISNLAKFEISFRKKVGILLIDEVFDYLDGSNLLAVQFYLSELIAKCKSTGKVLFPIIFTHLDPEVFDNYYFKKKKVHYISSSASINLDSKIVKLLRVRDSKNITADKKEEIEKFYIHFNDEIHSLSEELLAQLEGGFAENNTEFRTTLYNEIKERYLKEKAYDPTMVVAGIRVRIEELVFQKLDPKYRDEFIQQHKVKNKLEFAENHGIEVPELFYLLQPLYNDGMHLNGDENNICRKIKSCYLKTNNFHIKRMIEKLFC